VDVRRDENYRESWYVTNRTNKSINIGDLPLVPTLKPKKSIDVLKFYTREKVSHSIILTQLVKSRRLTLNKKKIFAGNDVIPIADIDEAITPAEENELGAPGQLAHTHDNLEVLDLFDEDSAGLIWNGEPIRGIAVSIHNDLDGLQGGDVLGDEFYHLDYAELVSLTGGPDEFADDLHSHSGVANIDGGYAGSTYGGGVSLLGVEGGDAWGNSPSA